MTQEHAENDKQQEKTYTQTSQKTSALAIVGLVVAILALLGAALPILNNISFFFALIALVFGIIAMIGIVKKRKRGKGLAIAGIVISILSVVVVLVTQSIYGAAVEAVNDSMESFDAEMSVMTGEATEEILDKDVKVEMGEYALEQGEYGLVDSNLPVTVTNLTNDKKSFSIQIEAVDSNGNRVKDDYIYANDLAAGQSQTFDCFVLVTSDDYEAMSAVQFKIVEVSEF